MLINVKHEMSSLLQTNDIQLGKTETLHMDVKI